MCRRKSLWPLRSLSSSAVACSVMHTGSSGLNQDASATLCPVDPDVLGLQGPMTYGMRTERSSFTNRRAPPRIASRPTLVRGAEDAPQGPHSAHPRRPLRQPKDATTRACGRHARSIRGGPRRAVQIIPAPWARPPSSSVAAKMFFPSFRRWPDQVFDALDLIAQPLAFRSGRRGTRQDPKK